ncbi:hypothetical protein B0T11DRAFT_299087 [Plectosphaerella cucumerina]|uniref:Uncharacterized protein n=1 Tax=Plectosphaerella cucumerina TaxID=40658 RepID=A0A8K0TAB8_9PEZI|nr:hypothetical protein B0T11DRAFT_299087 [Plectosphaerella cucumerina]
MVDDWGRGTRGGDLDNGQLPELTCRLAEAETLGSYDGPMRSRCQSRWRRDPCSDRLPQALGDAASPTDRQTFAPDAEARTGGPRGGQDRGVQRSGRRRRNERRLSSSVGRWLSSRNVVCLFASASRPNLPDENVDNQGTFLRGPHRDVSSSLRPRAAAERGGELLSRRIHQKDASAPSPRCLNPFGETAPRPGPFSGSSLEKKWALWYASETYSDIRWFGAAWATVDNVSGYVLWSPFTLTHGERTPAGVQGRTHSHPVAAEGVGGESGAVFARRPPGMVGHLSSPPLFSLFDVEYEYLSGWSCRARSSPSYTAPLLPAQQPVDVGGWRQGGAYSDGSAVENGLMFRGLLAATEQRP